MLNNPLVSIIVPTLNAGKLLPDLLNSVVNQAYKNVEVIINDDLRTADNTKDVISSFSSKLNITLINKNERLGGARLEGAKLAKGEYLLHLDADMQLTNNVITACVNLATNNQASAIYIPEEVIGSGFFTKAKWLEKRCYTGDEDISSPRFFNKEIYFLVGGHNPKLNLSEDKDVDLKFKKYKQELLAKNQVEAANSVMQWSPEFIYHNERRISLKKTFLNKLYWSQTGFEYLAVQPVAAWKQVLFIFFRPAYIRNWKFLLKHPFLTFGMYLLKVAELSGAILGGVGTKLGLIKPVSYSNTNNK